MDIRGSTGQIKMIRGLGRHEERVLDGRKVDFLHEEEYDGAFYEDSMTIHSVGMEGRLRIVLVGLGAMGTFPEMKALSNRQRWTCCHFTLVSQWD